MQLCEWAVFKKILSHFSVQYFMNGLVKLQLRGRQMFSNLLLVLVGSRQITFKFAFFPKNSLPFVFFRLRVLSDENISKKFVYLKILISEIIKKFLVFVRRFRREWRQPTQLDLDLVSIEMSLKLENFYRTNLDLQMQMIQACTPDRRTCRCRDCRLCFQVDLALG